MLSWLAAVLAWMSAHGFDPQTLIAGFLGGIVRSFVARVGTITERIFSGFTGCAFAVYFGASVAAIVGIPLASGCFVAGMLGIYVAETLVNVAKWYVNNPGAARDLLIKMLSKGK
ncbi:hypothetical protein CDO26_27900 (plasmid) [Sinorhizobium meliloti]|uniref:hypothetical protein n=1 Tax=Rhizobium meliloti TaxID=382 RepID=UPI000B4A10AB|nr:hypothetical protein [Sinorhizobium meliloti]ASP88175.1 hypothetical protein CDO26_27900 [Sinorhizobium meliloti]MQW30006.1 hypothetical protein [Sinorhizobium meliloti]